MCGSARYPLRIIGVLGAAAALSVSASLPAVAQESSIMFDVANPGPGDTIHVGNLVIQGTAMDTAADSGNGIDAIDIFVGDRDQGGMIVGHGTFDVTQLTDTEGGGMVVGQTDDSAANTWNAEVTLPSNLTGSRTLWFYVHSAITGEEQTVSIPVTIAR